MREDNDDNVPSERDTWTKVLENKTFAFSYQGRCWSETRLSLVALPPLGSLGLMLADLTNTHKRRSVI